MYVSWPDAKIHNNKLNPFKWEREKQDPTLLNIIHFQVAKNAKK